jgi:hypothetical protein
MREYIENALRNVKKANAPESTYNKIEDTLHNLEHKNGVNYIKPNRKKIIVIAAAVTIMMIITGTAFAAMSLWNQQQAELRSFLNIEDKDIPEYVEYNTPILDSNIEGSLNDSELTTSIDTTSKNNDNGSYVTGSKGTGPKGTGTKTSDFDKNDLDPIAENKLSAGTEPELNSPVNNIDSNLNDSALHENNINETAKNDNSLKVNNSTGSDPAPIDDNKLKVNILSSMKDLEFMRYYISVSPVTLEQAENCSWLITREGMYGWRIAAWINGDLDRTYDEKSQSLLLQFSFNISDDKGLDWAEPYMVTLLREDRSVQPPGIKDVPTTVSQRRALAPEAFLATEFMIIPNTIDVATVMYSFGDGVEYINPLTGETGLILGAEVSSNSFVWIHNYPSMEEHHAAVAAGNSQYITEHAAWINSFEDTIRDFVLVMSDGSAISAPIPNSTQIEGETLRSHAHFESPIELYSIENIVYDGKSYSRN